MFDQTRSIAKRSGRTSRRDFLRMGSLLVPVGLALPSLLRAQSAPTSFTFYISPTGSDSNPGTLTSPWAITSLQTSSANWSKIDGKGVSIGLLPGTYNVGTMMFNDPVSGALQVPGGTSSAVNYLASCNSSGSYQRGTATITAYANGLYGGFHCTGPGVYDGPVISHSGEWPTSYTVGNLVIDGLILTGFSYKGIRIGGASSGDGPAGISNVTIQNCTFTGGGYNAGDLVDNQVAVWIDSTNGCTVTNCWFYNNLGHGGATDMDHLNAIIMYGPNSGGSSGYAQNNVFTYNTCVNAGNIYGKYEAIEASTVAYNYIDVSMYSSACCGYQDFTGAPTSGLSGTTYFHNNIVLMQGNTVGGNVAFGWPENSNSDGYTTPVYCFNNTVIVTSGSAGPVVAWMTGTGGAAGNVYWYNNIYVNQGSGGSWNGFGNYYLNPSGPKVWDYNLFPSSGVSWVLYGNSNLSSAVASCTSASSFASTLASNGGISGAEAHSIAGTPTFVGSGGTLAAQYQLASGSLGKGAGSTNGTSSGSSTDMGAWGNGATQIGCNFASSAAVPSAPVLSVG